MQNQAVTQLTAVSEWVTNLKFEDIPNEVVEIAKCQILDAISAICAGSRCTAGVKIQGMLDNIGSMGQSTRIPSGQLGSTTDSIYYHASLINALELDNFSFFGHFGQSAVSVSMALSELKNKKGEDMILAQVAALEVAGRLGAYLTSGPQQGHMRAYVHRVAGAVASAKILNFDAHTTSKALAITLSMPEFPLFPSSFSAETKVICTSDPAVAGYRAALLAAQGFDAPLDVIEHPMGFWRFFSYKKSIPEIWMQIGKTWVTHTISFKNFATCAYAQGPVNAAVDIFNEPAFKVDQIKSIEVEVPMVTMIMEKFSMPHLEGGLTVVNTNFSTKRSVAAALLYGELTGDFFREGHFEVQVDPIRDLSEKVELIHDWKMTIDLIKGIDQGLAGAGKPGVLGMAGAGNTLKEFKKHFGSQPLLSWSDIPKLFSESRADRNYFFKRYWTGIRARLPFYSKSAKDKFRSHEQDLSSLSFKLAGRVTVQLKDGQKITKQCIIPPGFAGDQHRKEVVVQKFFRETLPALGASRAKKIYRALGNFENQEVKDFLSVFREH